MLLILTILILRQWHYLVEPAGGELILMNYELIILELDSVGCFYLGVEWAAEQNEVGVD